MNEEQKLKERIQRLENTVERLEKKVAAIKPAPGSKSASLSTPPPPVPAKPLGAKASGIIQQRPLVKPIKSEDILNKIGIGLLLLGLAFFFKYSIDQGWMTPVTRIGSGFLLGTGLLGVGLWLRKRHEVFAKVLQGGSIATYYLTIFAAYQLYKIIPYPISFGLMAAVTVLAFSLSVQQLNPVLSVIAVLGGFGTPFILYSGARNISGLMTYSGFILLGAYFVYYFRGWRILVPLAGCCMWLIIMAAHIGGLSFREQGVMQCGIMLNYFSLAAIAISHEVIKQQKKSKWADTAYRSFEDKFCANFEHAIAVSTPFVTIALSMLVWDLSKERWGWIILAVALGYAGLSYMLRHMKLKLSYTHCILAVMLGTWALVQLFEDNALLFILAAEATILHLVAMKLTDRILYLLAHVVFAVVGLWLGFHLLIDEMFDLDFVDRKAWVDLAAIIMALGVSVKFKDVIVKLIYQVAGHAGMLLWFFHQYSHLEQGQAYTSISWGLYALAVLVVGFLADRKYARISGLGMVYLVVGKLLLVDLASVAAIWRVLLFMGFGMVLLLLSYHLPRLMKTYRPDND